MVIHLLPPLTITEEQLDQALNAIENALTHRTGRAKRVETPAVDPEVGLLRSMLAIPSYSGREGALARYLVQQAERLGLSAGIDEVGNFVATLPGTQAEEAPIVLLGHMDTVGEVVPVRLENSALYGRGAVDAKGPLAAFLCAASRLARAGGMRRPVVLIGAVEEEAATSRGARAVVERYRPAACVIGEPSGSRAVTIGYKGRLLLEYTLNRACGHTAGPQVSSGETAVALWQRLREHASAWNRERAGESAFAALSPTLRSINSMADGLSESTRMVIGYRLPLGFDAVALRSMLWNWAREDEAGLEFTSEEAAFASDRSTPLARSFVRAIRATGAQPTFKLKTGTSDMNVVGPVWGGNLVAYGPGDSSLDHTPNEHILIEEYRHAIGVLEMVLRDWCCSTTEPL